MAARVKRPDRMAELKAQIKDLQEQLAVLNAKVVASGKAQEFGTTHVATVIVGPVHNVDWKTVARKAGASRQLIRANTTIQQRTQVRITAK